MTRKFKEYRYRAYFELDPPFEPKEEYLPLGSSHPDMIRGGVLEIRRYYAERAQWLAEQEALRSGVVPEPRGWWARLRRWLRREAA